MKPMPKEIETLFIAANIPVHESSDWVELLVQESPMIIERILSISENCDKKTAEIIIGAIEKSLPFIETEMMAIRDEMASNGNSIKLQNFYSGA